MMTAAAVRYLRSCVSDHLRRCFAPEGQAAYENAPVRWVPMAEIAQPTERAVFIPIDAPAPPQPDAPWRVPFGTTHLTLWNRLKPPSPDWRPDDDGRPLWYRHPCGAVTPAWNLAPTLFDLLTLREERESDARDAHGRFVAAMSPRASLELLQAPLFNDSVAALVAACDGLRHRDALSAALRPELVRRPALVLSHDLDQLRGNDRWTQLARLSRVFRPRVSAVRLRNLWYACLNAAQPRRYYFDNVVGMLAVERMLGYTSSLYFLNGQGGRFGARSGSGLIKELAALVPGKWSRGIHYNFDTFLDAERFRAQQRELEELLGMPVVTGRAHYLRFDGLRSWRFLASRGIHVDESLGYPDAIGYRAGIAGPFVPFDTVAESTLPVLEMPLVVMESALTEQGPDEAVEIFVGLMRHLCVVGGALSLLFHPGQFHNPEYPETLGVYRRLLGVARDLGARSSTAAQLVF
jgi:hypothetical protein